MYCRRGRARKSHVALFYYIYKIIYHHYRRDSSTFSPLILLITLFISPRLWALLKLSPLSRIDDMSTTPQVTLSLIILLTSGFYCMPLYSLYYLRKSYWLSKLTSWWRAFARARLPPKRYSNAKLLSFSDGRRLLLPREHARRSPFRVRDNAGTFTFSTTHFSMLLLPHFRV